MEKLNLISNSISQMFCIWNYLKTLFFKFSKFEFRHRHGLASSALPTIFRQNLVTLFFQFFFHWKVHRQNADNALKSLFFLARLVVSEIVHFSKACRIAIHFLLLTFCLHHIRYHYYILSLFCVMRGLYPGRGHNK